MTDIRYKYPHAKILVFAKAPVKGRVKTRLAKSIGDTAALRFYEEMLVHTLQMACQYKLAQVELHVAGNPEHPGIQSLAKQFDVAVKIQQGCDLGERMHYALEQSLQNCHYSILIGTDCPVMNVDYLANALTALVRGQDAVLGPAEDGGYVLIGARRLHRDWFKDVAWGSHHVLEQCRHKIINCGSRLEELQMLWDVDRVADLQRWQMQSGV